MHARPEHMINFETHPDRYRHWRLNVTDHIATLTMDVDENAGLTGDYLLKLNSYDLSVDIELADAIQRLRFEHPEVTSVVVDSGKDKVFCAGANIRMLAAASHEHKVNFCKFTNETRNSIEDAGRHSDQHYIAAIKGACAGGGYELALACEKIILVDDGAASVALPEVPLLAVLPGTGGLTRLTDKRRVRRDRADVFCCIEEGIKGQKAADWNLVDAIAPASRFEETVNDVAAGFSGAAPKANAGEGVPLNPLNKTIDGDHVRYGFLELSIDREESVATLMLSGPDSSAPDDSASAIQHGDGYWFLQLAREIDDALLHLRFNETEIGVLCLRSRGDPGRVLEFEELQNNDDDWFISEVNLLWTRVLKRLDLTSRSLVALIEPNSCFAGTLFELVLACDRSYMTEGEFEDFDNAESAITLCDSNFGRYPMCNGLSRLQTRFYGSPDHVEMLPRNVELNADDAFENGLVTEIFDDIDWEDEIRLVLEERASFSADAMTAMEANLRFPGPETMETRIFARLTAWQNWVFQRSNAVGEDGALQRYGSGQRPIFDQTRV
ncbi:MAG: 2,3-epoxybenzoyl-CoA dihydrolase [Pseudomonadota bacterium]